MQAIYHLYTTNQSTKKTAQPSKRNASGTRMGRTNKKGRTSSRADRGATETRAWRVSEDVSRGSSTDRPARGEPITEDSKIDGRMSDICELQRTGLQNTSESPANRQPIAREIIKRTLSVYGLEGVTAFKLFPLRRGFQSPKKDHLMLYLNSSST
jgi:hypothetical protein